MKIFHLSRVLALALALLTLLSVILGMASCGVVQDPNGKDTGSGNTAADESGESETAAYSTVEKQNFNRVFSIRTREDLVDDMYIEELTNNILDDSIYERNAAVEKDFGVTIAIFSEGTYDTINEELKLQTSGGLDDYDVFIGHKYSFATCAQQNYCLNLNSIDTLDLTQPWWDQNCYENLTIDDKTYLMTGDILPSSMRISSCMIFNKNMLKNMQKSPEELYALTNAGNWTLDVLYEYTTDVSRDLNGDGIIEYTSDQYGLSSWMMDIPYSMYYGAGTPFIQLVDGTPEASYDAETVSNIYEKMYDIIVENESYFVTDVNVYDTCYAVFRDGRSLFCDITLGKITTFIVREGMSDSYGILPMPKYSTSQAEYLSFVNGASGMIMLANTEEDPEFVGTILTAMAAYNYDNVTPNMFEVVTKLQAAEDLDSAHMVDYIVRNRIYDLGYWYDFSITNLINNSLREKKDTIASPLKSASRQTNNDLKKLIAAYEKCE